jgi:hypothetical protein
LISLLAINGLRVSEALGANIEALGIERGHRTLTVVRKGGKTVVIPLATRTARAIDLAIGERVEGPIFLATNGARLDRPDRPGGSCDDSHAGLESTSPSGRTRCATPSSPPRSTPACRCAMSKKRRATPIPAPRCATTGLGSPSTATPPTSSLPSSRAPPDS